MVLTDCAFMKLPDATYFWHKKLLVSKIIPIFAQSLQNEIEICQKYLDSLDSPSSFTVRSMSLSTFTLKGTGGMAKFVWNGSEFTLLVKEKIKANDLKKIKAVIDENADLIIKRWEEHFNS